LKGFLPSDKILYTPRRGLYAIDPQTRKTQPIFQMTAEDEQNGNYLADGEMVVVSENLIISGDGDYDMGLNKGNILLFDVERARVRRGAQINGFKSGRLSPGGKYVLYEYAGELSNSASLYDIARNVNHQLPKRFNFKLHFPKYKKINVFPLTWINADRFIAAVDENQGDDAGEENKPADFTDTPAWLALFDVVTGKIVWKEQLTGSVPIYVERLSLTQAFFENGDGLFEISLADGRLTKLPAIKGTGFAVSPDKKRLAFLNGNQIFVSSLNGADKRLILEYPRIWQGSPSSYGLGTRSLNWSPDGKRLLVFDENRLLLVEI
jgi:hypothetical protein